MYICMRTLVNIPEEACISMVGEEAADGPVVKGGVCSDGGKELQVGINRNSSSRLGINNQPM